MQALASQGHLKDIVKDIDSSTTFAVSDYGDKRGTETVEISPSACDYYEKNGFNSRRCEGKPLKLDRTAEYEHHNNTLFELHKKLAIDLAQWSREKIHAAVADAGTDYQLSPSSHRLTLPETGSGSSRYGKHGCGAENEQSDMLGRRVDELTDLWSSGGRLIDGDRKQRPIGATADNKSLSNVDVQHRSPRRSHSSNTHSVSDLKHAVDVVPMADNPLFQSSHFPSFTGLRALPSPLKLSDEQYGNAAQVKHVGLEPLNTLFDKFQLHAADRDIEQDRVKSRDQVTKHMSVTSSHGYTPEPHMTYHSPRNDDEFHTSPTYQQSSHSLLPYRIPYSPRSSRIVAQQLPSGHVSRSRDRESVVSGRTGSPRTTGSDRNRPDSQPTVSSHVNTDVSTLQPQQSQHPRSSFLGNVRQPHDTNSPQVLSSNTADKATALITSKEQGEIPELAVNDCSNESTTVIPRTGRHGGNNSVYLKELQFSQHVNKLAVGDEDTGTINDAMLENCAVDDVECNGVEGQDGSASGDGGMDQQAKPPIYMIPYKKPKRCPEKGCNYATKDKVDYWQHKRVHYSDEKLFFCVDCPFIASVKHHYEQHVRGHKGDKPFECDVCGYRAVSRSMITSHAKSHSAEKPFVCLVADCSYATKFVYQLKGHLARHHPECLESSDYLHTPKKCKTELNSHTTGQLSDCSQELQNESETAASTDIFRPEQSKILATNAAMLSLAMSPNAWFPYNLLQGLAGSVPAIRSSPADTKRNADSNLLYGTQSVGTNGTQRVKHRARKRSPSPHPGIDSDLLLTPGRTVESFSPRTATLPQSPVAACRNSAVKYSRAVCNLQKDFLAGQISVGDSDYRSWSVLHNNLIASQNDEKSVDCYKKLLTGKKSEILFESGNTNRTKTMDDRINGKKLLSSLDAECPVDLTTKQTNGEVPCKEATVAGGNSVTVDNNDADILTDRVANVEQRAIVTEHIMNCRKPSRRKGVAHKVDAQTVNIWDDVEDFKDFTAVNGDKKLGGNTGNCQNNDNTSGDACGDLTTVDSRSQQVDKCNISSDIQQKDTVNCNTPPHTVTREQTTATIATGHQTSSPGRYKCPHCLCIYRHAAMFDIHMGFHQFDDPWRCNRCGQRCTNSLDFNHHIATFSHLGQI